MAIDEWIQQLAELEARYQEWAKPINEAIRQSMFKVNRREYTMSDFNGDVEAVRKRQLAIDNPYEAIYTLLDELCPAYLQLSADDRERIREAVDDKGGVCSALLGYVYRAADRIHSPADRGWLRKGLAAISIENCSRDWRDDLLALAELYVSAEKAGIRPRRDFTAVGKLSSDRVGRGGQSSMRDMLAHFHGYGALRERRRREEKEAGKS